MNETTARRVLLMQAIETADQEGQVLSDADRLHASRTAREMANWRATETHAPDLSVPVFLDQRARLVLERVTERHPAFRGVTKPGSRWPLYLLPLVGLFAGAAIDHVAHPHRIDILSAPLLGIIAWNLLVYALLFVRLLLRVIPGREAGVGLLTRKLSGTLAGIRPAAARLPHPLLTATASFGSRWRAAAAPLTGARVECALHLAACAFTAGVIASLYMRGLLTQYIVGWESTFLDAGQVHALMAAVFTPATKLLGMTGFSISEMEALRFGAPVHPAVGAHWVHLYAATLALIVVLPRAMLAALAGLRALWLARHFAVDLADPYFARLCGTGSLLAGPRTLRIIPYSFQLDDPRTRALNDIAQRMFGDRVELALRPSVVYGEAPPEIGREARTLTAALFNAAATPEQDTHGAFLRQLHQALGELPRALVDISGIAARLGHQPDSAQRLATRRDLWRRFAESHSVPVSFIDLQAPEKGELP
ncbi:DUF2868 domain-containing protein [Massilia arenosa]|uniref:DUF2868 domain-containing protein n=1 Tax=Zemynaea arenosa TaxID=2561931 RepID=A0A4Y9SNP9_9BURK|nr:DUF2868 domain-containing protein [Massilia arenosa]TFW27137.1 DUF2868 domain-containing protein [Massilia arenosa]